MPKIFWLSISYVREESQFIEDCDRFSKQLPRGVLLVLGGNALHEGLRKRLSFSAYCDSMQQLSNLARTIRVSIPPPQQQI
jgi:hypothetical protein